jgi:ABC-type antimicrobial peptide transport system permease subunit
LSYARGVDAAALERSLSERFPVGFSGYARPVPPELLRHLGRLRPTLFALGAFLAGLGALGLVHFLALSTRNRRHELAVLRSLGFVRRQIRGTVAWQAATVAVIGLLAGIPLGIIAGRAAWIAAVDQIGMLDAAAVPVPTVLALTAASLLGAAALGSVAGWRAARRRPSAALRAE